MYLIETRSLTKIYTSGFLKRVRIRALDSVSVHVERGEIFGLLGPNGAGKTTFVRILLGITHPTSGDATILGAPVSKYRHKKQLGFLPENHRYPTHLTGEGVLKYFGALSGITRRELSTRTDKLLDMVGMSQWRKVKLRKYSKGMLQRIGLAQALMNDPALVFLDEPTDGVDPVGRKEIRDILKYLQDQGKTIFLNSHLLSEVEMICDRVAILNRGSVVRIGPVHEFTQASNEVEITFDGNIHDELRQKLSQIDASIQYQRKSITVSAEDRETVNRILDLLRSNGIYVQSMSQRKTTLEESFINLIGNTKKE